MAFGIISDRDISIFERLMLYLDYAKRIQKHLDAERDELIVVLQSGSVELITERSCLTD